MGPFGVGEMWQAGIAISFAAYTGGKASADVATVRRQIEEIDTGKQQAALGITLDVRQAWLTCQNAFEQMKAADRELTAANEALRIAEIRYKNGEGIALEVD